MPIDISWEHLRNAAAQLRKEFPGLAVVPLWADYTKPLTLPPGVRATDRRVVYFPGSTIGNFHPAEARAFLARIARLAGRDGALIIGVDLKKDRARLERAYNDREGVTAAFNLNLLARINEELGGEFPLDRFRHNALYNEELGRVEMHLVSLDDRSVRIGPEDVWFMAGETIWTESSYKYSLEEFATMADSAGFETFNVWTDAECLFSVHHLRVRRSG